jgi:hypothetical protein
MKTSLLIAALAAAFGIAFSVSSSAQKDPNFTPPGTEELAAVERANATIDAVYAQLRNKLGPEETISKPSFGMLPKKTRRPRIDLECRCSMGLHLE